MGIPSERLELIIKLLGPTISILVTAVCATIVAVALNTYRINSLELRAEADRKETRQDFEEIKELIISSKAETIRELRSALNKRN
jgi:uncharacterized membrane protein (DUF106 family)